MAITSTERTNRTIPRKALAGVLPMASTSDRPVLNHVRLTGTSVAAANGFVAAIYHLPQEYQSQEAPTALLSASDLAAVAKGPKSKHGLPQEVLLTHNGSGPWTAKSSDNAEYTISQSNDHYPNLDQLFPPVDMEPGRYFYINLDVLKRVLLAARGFEGDFLRIQPPHTPGAPIRIDVGSRLFADRAATPPTILAMPAGSDGDTVGKRAR